LGLDYFFFGLRVRSNVPLPAVVSSNSLECLPELDLHLGMSPFPTRKGATESEELTYASCREKKNDAALRIWSLPSKGLLRIAYSDGTQFWLDRKLENLWATWSPSSSLEDTLTYLLGPVLGILLRLRGVTCLHGSAVAFGDSVVAFVGPPGAGKSTTAAVFARQGNGIVSDDIVALTEKGRAFHVLPAYPHLCLWPDSVHMLYGSPEALPRFVTGWEKRRLPLGEAGTRFESRTLPLAGIYVVGDRRPDPAPYVEKVAAQNALISLVTETYATNVLDRELRAREFTLLGRLVTEIPIRRIHANEDANRLEDLCRLVHGDLVNTRCTV